MKIIFAGEMQLTARVRALSGLLTHAQHQVSVCVAASITPASARKATGIQIRRIPSLGTGQTGEWVYTLLALFTLWRARPQVVHMFGWKMAAVAPLLRLLLPPAVIIWTPDGLPQRALYLAQAVARQAVQVCDAVTVARRDLQWHLLQRTGVRAEYIPDGYLDDHVPLVSVRRWGLWKDRYCVTSAQTFQELAWIAKAYGATKSRKKLVVLTQEAKGLTSLARKFPFLRIIETSSQRVRASLMYGAAVIVLGSRSDDSATILGAMTYGKPIIATALPFHEETLGVTAAYVEVGDIAGLTSIWRRELKGGTTRSTRARKRAENHFRWERILLDYLHLYQPLTRYVPLDSVQKVKFTEPVVN